MKNPNNTFDHKEQIFFLHKWMCNVLLVLCAITTCTSYLEHPLRLVMSFKHQKKLRKKLFHIPIQVMHLFQKT